LDHEREYGLHIIILPHEGCNFRCVYCYEKLKRGRMEADIVNGIKALVEQKINDYNRFIVSWYGGEPLLALDIIHELSDEFIDICDDVPYFSFLTTNGYLLTPDVVKSLLKRQVKGFQITLDGYKSYHNKMRKLKNNKGTYDKIIDNLMEMRKINGDFNVTIRINFNNDTLPSMGNLFNEISPLAEDSRFNVYFRPVGKWGGDNDSNFDICDRGFAKLKIMEFNDNASKLGFSDQFLKQYLMSQGNACFASKESSLLVRSDGVLCKCLLGLDDPINNVGKLTKDGDLIINKKKWDLWTKLDDKDVSKCVDCWFFPSCQSRYCPLDTINNKKPSCPMTFAEYESMVKLVASGRQEVGDEI